MILSFLVLLLFGLSATTEAAVCLANAKPCGNQGVPSNDRLCCPGSICGWGNVCNPGCRISGVLYRAGEKNPSNPCQVCTPSSSTTLWSSAVNGTYCSDGNACTQTDTCQYGTCRGSNPVTCPEPDQCHSYGTCNPSTGVCSNPKKVDGSYCSDGNACTQTDSCQNGYCRGDNPVVCADPDQCHDRGTCNPLSGTCSNPTKPDGTTCSDSDACTRTDTCRYGTCRGDNPVVCQALDQCHDAGTCDHASGACSNPPKPEGSACNDGNVCTQTDTCCIGTCRGSNPVVCPTPDQCHDPGTCDPATGGCSNPRKPDGSACSDSDACTQTDTCRYGTCRGDNPIVCQALDQCHDAGTCDHATGVCSNPISPEGSPCDDGNACTTQDSCCRGACTNSTPVVCGPPADCHEPGVCDPSTGSCSYAASPDLSPCDDGNPCDLDYCLSGACDGHDSDHCANGTQDCDETGTDCGGSCDPCLSCDSPGSCGGGFSNCNNSAGCYCYNAGTGNVCAPAFFCDELAVCLNGPDDCPVPGSACVLNTCCGLPVCIPSEAFCSGETAHLVAKPAKPGKTLQNTIGR